MNQYETVFILNPVLSEKQVEDTVKKYEDLGKSTRKAEDKAVEMGQIPEEDDIQDEGDDQEEDENHLLNFINTNEFIKQEKSYNVDLCIKNFYKLAKAIVDHKNEIVSSESYINELFS